MRTLLTLLAALAACALGFLLGLRYARAGERRWIVDMRDLGY
jgi:hypothetical protein